MFKQILIRYAVVLFALSRRVFVVCVYVCAIIFSRFCACSFAVWMYVLIYVCVIMPSGLSGCMIPELYVKWYHSRSSRAISWYLSNIYVCRFVRMCDNFLWVRYLARQTDMNSTWHTFIMTAGGCVQGIHGWQWGNVHWQTEFKQNLPSISCVGQGKQGGGKQRNHIHISLKPYSHFTLSHAKFLQPLWESRRNQVIVASLYWLDVHSDVYHKHSCGKFQIHNRASCLNV
jgi:hypothetical protein